MIGHAMTLEQKKNVTAGPWRPADEIPPVSKGRMREYVVAVRRAHSGKVYEFAACYLNAYPLEYRDCCPKGNGCDGNGCDDGCPTTGWFDQTGDDYYDSMFRALSLNEGDEHLGWCELPRWDAAALIAASKSEVDHG